MHLIRLKGVKCLPSLEALEIKAGLSPAGVGPVFQTLTFEQWICIGLCLFTIILEIIYVY